MTKLNWDCAPRRCALGAIAACALASLALPNSLSAQSPFGFPQRAPLFPGNLVVSRSVYDNLAGNVTVGETLPPNCVASTDSCVQAVNNGTYPYVFNNAPVDASFGITSRIYLDQMTPSGRLVNTMEVPNSLDRGVGRTATSWSPASARSRNWGCTCLWTDSI